MVSGVLLASATAFAANIGPDDNPSASDLTETFRADGCATFSASSRPTDRYSTYDYLAPGVLLTFTGSYPTGAAAASGGRDPIDEGHTRYHFTWGPARCEGRSFLIDGMVALATLAFSEDKAMIEAQQRLLNRHPDTTMHPIIHDRGPNLMRSVMERLIREETRGGRSGTGQTVSSVETLGQDSGRVCRRAHDELVRADRCMEAARGWTGLARHLRCSLPAAGETGPSHPS